MNKNTPNLNNLTAELSKTGFLNSTYNQINKDLEGLSVQKIKKTDILFQDPLSELKRQLFEIIHLLEEVNKIQQFIYKVDLKEHIYMNYVSGDINTDEFSFQIIYREAQKVYLRSLFNRQ